MLRENKKWTNMGISSKELKRLQELEKVNRLKNSAKSINNKIIKKKS